jgi:hypothetical protein
VVAVFGMIAGAAFTHWFGLASSPAGLTDKAWPSLAVMAVILGAIALLKRARAA